MRPYKEWIDRAYSAFELSRDKVSEKVYYEDLCARAQESAEKALKGLLVFYGVEPEYTHDIGKLLNELKKYTDLNDEIKNTKHLTKYAYLTRYPGSYKDVIKEEHKRAVDLAEYCLDWVEMKINEESN